jgi:hypothetical protein
MASRNSHLDPSLCSAEAEEGEAHLEVFWTELVAIHVNGGQKDGLHLVVPQFIGWEVGGDQDLKVKGVDGGLVWLKWGIKRTTHWDSMLGN